MTDPLYIYVKGKGWILESSFNTLTLRNGQIVRLEFRVPLLGERYVFYNKSYEDEYFDDNGDFILSKFQSNYSNMLAINDFNYCDNNQKTSGGNKFYITLIPL